MFRKLLLTSTALLILTMFPVPPAGATFVDQTEEGESENQIKVSIVKIDRRDPKRSRMLIIGRNRVSLRRRADGKITFIGGTVTQRWLASLKLSGRTGYRSLGRKGNSHDMNLLLKAMKDLTNVRHFVQYQVGENQVMADAWKMFSLKRDMKTAIRKGDLERQAALQAEADYMQTYYPGFKLK